ncbi:MAG: prepilin-type N-terminal cleavage/methylation domain-containing protein [Gemmatimonadales bacterium]
MAPRSRQGFSLVEMLIALVLLGLVSVLLYGVLSTAQRLSRTQAQQTLMSGNMRTGELLAPYELRQINISPAGVSDIRAMGPDSITYRAMRGNGVACSITATEVRVLTSTWYAYRNPVAGRDTLLVFLEVDPNLTADDQWVALPISSVNMSSTCGARGAIAFGTLINVLTYPLTSFLPTGVTEAPMRTFETMQLKLMSSGGQYFLGARSVSNGDALAEAVGPLAASGFRLAFYDSTGAATTNVGRVRTVDIVVTALSDGLVRASASSNLTTLQDSMTTSVSLRNVPRR